MKRIVISILVLLCLISTATFAIDYAGGTGDPGDPYQIETPQHLNTIGLNPQHWHSNFILVNDIDMSAYSADQFNIIGNEITPFDGCLDGNNYTIENFTYSDPDADYVGIFGYIEKLTPSVAVKNLKLENASITARDYTSAIAGYCNSAQIVNCSVDAVVNADYYASGIAGVAYNTSFQDCSFTGSIIAQDQVGAVAGLSQYSSYTHCHSSAIITGSSSGGLIGKSINDIIMNCYSDSSILDGYYSGALIGWMRFTQLSSCYSFGSVTGTDYIGGLCGKAESCDISDAYSTAAVNSTATNAAGFVAYVYKGTVKNCYSTGSVTASSPVAGFIAANYADNIQNCLWDTETSGHSIAAALGSIISITGKTTSQMRSSQTIIDAGWDMVHTWDVFDRQAYPCLRTYNAVDMNHDTIVDYYDLKLLSENWLQ